LRKLVMMSRRASLATPQTSMTRGDNKERWKIVCHR
jgi:hypothetical protein